MGDASSSSLSFLKRLRGTSIVRHDAEWAVAYNPHAPYEILQNKFIDFATMQRVRRFARYWDLVGNSGNFVETTPLIWSGNRSPFTEFLRWSDWLFAKIGRTDSIALARLAELLFNFLTEESAMDSRLAAETLWRDYQRGGRHDQPEFLRPHLTHLPPPERPKSTAASSQKRQARHLA